MRKSAIIILTLFFALSSAAFAQGKNKFSLPYEKYTLANGLTVILHKDNSDPMVAVNILFHVGSAREEKGRTGFAHLFEHLMFNETQHNKQGEFDQILSNLGATNNASTGNDLTNYFEVLPKNGLESALYLEADRMGWLLGNLTQKSFQVQQGVVQNEKRQTGDNQPYGYADFAMSKLMYPEGHPYSWEVIGSMQDIRNATLQDVINFHNKWYSPSNATMVISGDFDVKETKKWIEKYFSEIKSYGKIPAAPKMPVKLDASKRAYFEDNFANAPDFTMSFPTVEEYNKDSYALSYLGQLLSSKKSPLYKIIVEEKKLASSVRASQGSMELAGAFDFSVRAFPGKNLTEVETAVNEALVKFEKDKFTDKDLQRLKTGIEVRFYNSISSVLGKANRLSHYNVMKGNPDFMATDMNNMLSVTKDDIWRVYNKYIKGKNFVLLSIVPKGQANLAAANSTLFVIPEESIKDQDKLEAKSSNVKNDPIPSKLDRSIKPVIGADPEIKVPKIWEDKTINSMKVYGIEQNETPLVQFTIVMDGGMLLDGKDKIGTSSLMARLMNEGTKKKTPVELTEAFQDLGANLNISSGTDHITISGSCLNSKLNGLVALAKEMILEPRWDEKEFNLLKQQAIDNLKRNETRATSVAGNVFAKLLYGADNILSNSPMGTVESLKKITLDDLKEYYSKYFSSATAKIMVVGAVNKAKATGIFNQLKEWKGNSVKMPEVTADLNVTKPGVYFVDIPNAKQSEFRVGHLSLPATDPDYYKVVVVNHHLGGDFISVLNQILREEKAYTYGAHSSVSESAYPGFFQINTGIQTNATFESAQIIKDEVAKYAQSIKPETMNLIKNSLLRSNALSFETLSALMRMLSPIVEYNYPKDYIKQQEEIVRNMTPEQHTAIAKKYIATDNMIYLIVGDKATQLDKLKALGLGDPILLDRNGKVISK